MKCYYQIDENWIKGEVESLGGIQVCFHSRDKRGRVLEEVTLTNPEIIFHGSGFTVTGYRRDDDKKNSTFHLESVEVRSKHGNN